TPRPRARCASIPAKGTGCGCAVRLSRRGGSRCRRPRADFENLQVNPPWGGEEAEIGTGSSPPLRLRAVRAAIGPQLTRARSAGQRHGVGAGDLCRTPRRWTGPSNRQTSAAPARRGATGRPTVAPAPRAARLEPRLAPATGRRALLAGGTVLALLGALT